MSMADFVALTDHAGVEVGVLRAGNAIITEVLGQYPKRFTGLATISPHDGMRGVRELVRLVNEHGFRALRVSSLHSMIPASDRRSCLEAVAAGACRHYPAGVPAGVTRLHRMPNAALLLWRQAQRSIEQLWD
jgi:predicted TIM-barrel fold metal-dependent hydrolase